RKLEHMKPEIVESSAPISPEWRERRERDDPARVVFVGASSGPSLDAAKDRATRDLFAAVASFVSVDVESSFESLQSSATAPLGGRTELQQVAETTRTRAGAELRGVAPDGYYWERLSTSPLVPESTAYEYWVRASVPKAEIVRARLQKQASREARSGKKT